MDINVLLFDGFETLDAFGPVEVLGGVEDFSLRYYSPEGGLVTSVQLVEVNTEPFAEADTQGVLLLPGGEGVRLLMQDGVFMKRLKVVAEQACCCLTVCTGSFLLAQTGLLDMKQATTNKRLFGMVSEYNPDVGWLRKARWAVDGKFYTASGVSAGIDMALGFVADYLDMQQAASIADHMEYIWNPDSTDDPFEKQE